MTEVPMANIGWDRKDKLKVHSSAESRTFGSDRHLSRNGLWVPFGTRLQMKVRAFLRSWRPARTTASASRSVHAAVVRAKGELLLTASP